MRRTALRMVAAFIVAAATLGPVTAAAQALRLGQAAPEITGGRWINSTPLDIRGLRGRVVAVEFWTYG